MQHPVPSSTDAISANHCVRVQWERQCLQNAILQSKVEPGSGYAACMVNVLGFL